MRTRDILERDNWLCAYGGVECGPATQQDHIVPVAMRRRHKGFDGPEFIVASCRDHNLKKGTRRYVPPSWAHRLHELPSTGWQVWGGGKQLEVRR